MERVVKMGWPWKWNREDTDFVPKSSKFQDITGNRYGRLVARCPNDRDELKRVRWLFDCDCGGTITLRPNGKYVYASSCGCDKLEWLWKWNREDTDFVPSHVIRFKDITGQRGGKLVAIYPTHQDAMGLVYWDFRCDCGGKLNYAGTKVMNGYKTSCGCTRAGVGHFGWSGYEAIPGKFLSVLKRSAEMRKHRFELTPQYLWNLFLVQEGKCALTELPLTFKDGHKRTNQTASLDRINSDLGYIEGNVQWVHRDINLMKNTLGQEQFILLCALVAEQYKRATVDLI